MTILARTGVIDSQGGAAPIDVEYLVVAAGGSGGGYDRFDSGVGAGGGGGGQVSTGTLSLLTGIAYTITVASTTNAPNDGGGETGGNSVFSTVTSQGGDGGYGSGNELEGPLGSKSIVGSGACVDDSGTTLGPGSGSVSSGGSAYASGAYATFAGGGGGGAGGNGGAGSSGTGGAGGAGVTSSITGTSVEYGKGGAGGVIGSSGYTAGAAGTGYGGGGGGAGVNYHTSDVKGGNGSQGVVIIKIPDTFTATFSGGTNTLSTAVSGYKIYTCSSTGTRTVTFS